MSKKDDFFSFGTDDLSEIGAGFDRQIDALGATDKNLAKARVMCIRGKFADALKIYEGIVDEEFENVDGYIGILRVHSKNFTVYDGAEIENDVEVIRQISRGEYTKDEEFTAYLTARRKHFEKIAEDKKKKAEADRIAAEKARQKAAEEAKRRAVEAEAAKKRAVEEAKRRAEQAAEAKKRAAEEAKRRAEEAEAAKKRAAEEAKRRAEQEAEAKKRAEEEKKKRKVEVKKLYDEDRYIEAFPDILRFAEEGDSDFWHRAGYCYDWGKGVTKDVDKAMYWYTKSAERGDKFSQYNLGQCYFYDKKDYSKAKYWWENAAAQGHENAKKKLNEHFSPEAVAKRQAEQEAAAKKRAEEAKKRAEEEAKRRAEEEQRKYIASHFAIENGVLKKFIGYGGSVTIPNCVTSIGENAFQKCNSLESVTIPDSVTSIGENAFSQCSGLKSVTIPNSVTSIGSWAFSDCKSLKNVIISNNITEIEDGVFGGCDSLKSVIIPSGVTSIGRSAFSECLNLKSITIPNGVYSIGDFAFINCRNLESVTIPDSVTSIGRSVFFETGLTIVMIPRGCKFDKSTFPSKCKVKKV